MHRCSESVAAIATALAKAQIELTNPEKSAVGSIRHHHHEAPQVFRYATLSSGLDIIRKTLGGHQIAIAQTTDIDRASGMVNLTTVLLHTSGEWISSDWPVCRLSETTAPRRMGAALTYARRYALFTMVGIAGEDDLDAPPDVTVGAEAVDGLVASSGPVPFTPSEARAGAATIPKIPAKLGAEESAAIRAQLVREIETTPEGDLQLRAMAILKAKNRISADDAKLVEEAFVARMAPQAGEGSTKDEPAITPIEPTSPGLPSASTDLVKPHRPRGRPRKTKTSVEKAVSVAPPMIDDATAETRDLDATTVVKIDKSSLRFGEVRRHRDKIHLRFVALQPCLLCGRTPSDPHHLRFAQSRALGRKTSDEFVVPLCRAHHSQNHQVGDEVSWWKRSGIDPLPVASRLWAISRRGVPDNRI
jgi:hypothetical protein